VEFRYVWTPFQATILRPARNRSSTFRLQFSWIQQEKNVLIKLFHHVCILRMQQKVCFLALLGLLAFANAQQPVVFPSTINIAPTADITISGRFFSPTASSNTVALSSGSCTVVYGSISTLVCRPTAGMLHFIYMLVIVRVLMSGIPRTALAVGPLYLNAVVSNGIPNAYSPPLQIAIIVSGTQKFYGFGSFQ
jgi:hypothetical protein